LSSMARSVSMKVWDTSSREIDTRFSSTRR
jgi:hypothetical protein